MRTRQAALLKDLLRLLTKYPARDWQRLVGLLTSNPRVLFQAVSDAGTKAPKIEKGRSEKGRTPKAAEQRKRHRTTKAKHRRSGAPKRTRSSSEDILIRRSLSLASVSELQALHFRAYRRKKIPKNRSELAAALGTYLRKLSEHERTRVLAASSRAQHDPTDTYRRWVKIISKGPRGADA